MPDLGTAAETGRPDDEQAEQAEQPERPAAQARERAMSPSGIRD
jgi:hypothetical protein